MTSSFKLNALDPTERQRAAVWRSQIEKHVRHQTISEHDYNYIDFVAAREKSIYTVSEEGLEVAIDLLGQSDSCI